jgi:hypothetical protein
VIFSDLLGPAGPHRLIFVVVGLVLIAMLVLTGFTSVFLWQTLFIIPRARRELIELNRRRADRVRDALSIGASINFPPNENTPRYPFSGWLNLAPGGKILISGQSFQFHETFEAIATDENFVTRARVLGKEGEILISSHGQFFAARFLEKENQWEVRTIPSVEQ